LNAEQASATVRQLAEEAGHHALAQSLDAIERRVRDGRFYVAVVGQFKRGKSTLVNALLGEPLLPVGVPPVTSVVALLRAGPTPQVSVHFRHAPASEVPLDRLGDYVAETGNPGNARGVSAVEIEWPLRLLESGLCLVDTPGVGSIFEANARETREFVPHVDAALMVLGVDPPVTAAEMDLLRDLMVERPPLLVVINKADLPTPQDLEAGVAFTRRVLRDALGQDPLLLVVSARAALEGRALADGRRDGGLADLRAALEGLARSAGSDLARRALVRGVSRARLTLIRALELERRALTEPEESLGELEAVLATQLKRIEGFLGDFRYEVRGELDRFATELQRQRDAFQDGAAAAAGDLAAAAAADVAGASAPAWESEATAVAWKRLLARIRHWETDLLPWVEDRQRALAERFTSEASALLAAVREQAADLAGAAAPDPPAPLFQPTARYYLAADAEVPAMDLSGLTDRVLRVILPADVWKERVCRRVAARVEVWARHNATRIASEISMAAEDAGRGFVYDLERSVRETAALAQTALARAQQQRAEGRQRVEEALSRLDGLLERCHAVGAFEARPAAPAA